MPLSQIDNVAALVVIDLQKGIVGGAAAHPASDITRAAPRASHAPFANAACLSCSSTSRIARRDAPTLNEFRAG